MIRTTNMETVFMLLIKMCKQDNKCL